MTWFTIIGDTVIFACGCAVGHYGPKAVVAFFKKEARKIRKRK